MSAAGGSSVSVAGGMRPSTREHLRLVRDRILDLTAEGGDVPPLLVEAESALTAALDEADSIGTVTDHLWHSACRYLAGNERFGYYAEPNGVRIVANESGSAWCVPWAELLQLARLEGLE